MGVTKMYIALRFRQGGLIWISGRPPELQFGQAFYVSSEANRSIRYHILDRRIGNVALKCF